MVGGLRWRLVRIVGTSRFWEGCCSTLGPRRLQPLKNSSAAGAQRGLLWGCGIVGGRNRALLLLPWVCFIDHSGRGRGAQLLLQLLLPVGCGIGHGGRGNGDLLLLQLQLLLVVWVIGHGGRGSGALPLLQLLVPPVGCDIGRSAGARLVSGIIWQWGLGERCLARPLLSPRVWLAIGLECCSWRQGVPGTSLPLLLVGGLSGMGLSLDLLVVLVLLCSRAGGLGSINLAVLRPVWTLWDLRMGSEGGGHPGPSGAVQRSMHWARQVRQGAGQQGPEMGNSMLGSTAPPACPWVVDDMGWPLLAGPRVLSTVMLHVPECWTPCSLAPWDAPYSGACDPQGASTRRLRVGARMEWDPLVPNRLKGGPAI